ncbi:MAG: hypothetical protein PF448_01825 [Bacteroidales bacterium]|jgi:tetratricopeptide (TPR) repeat protein|nr:hypothetical protein [Bacteroidales bacterium]
MRIISIIITVMCFSLSSLAMDSMASDTTKDENITVQMTQARVKYQNDNFEGALRIYRDLYKGNPDHSLLNYRMGETFFQLAEYGSVILHLKKLVNEDDKNMELLHYYLGRAYQKESMFNLSKDHYETFKDNVKGKLVKYYNVPTYLSQVKNAIALISEELEVEIENMGAKINSEYVDAIPSVTADQSQLIFTSRRPLNEKAQRDPFSGEYFDAVFVSIKNADGSWSEAKPIEGDINTEWHDANTSISPDGKTIYLYKNIKNETLSGDIYVSKLKDGKWLKPQPLPENKPEKFFQKLGNAFKTLFQGETAINSSYFETSAGVTADNNTIYFISERKKGFGEGDIYSAHRYGKGWSAPKNLGKKINTEDDEIGVFIHPDGNTLFFSSNGPGSMGGYDIFMVKRVNGRWQKPVNLGYPINTPDNEFHFVLSTDSKTAYISSDREGGLGKVDLYQIDMRNYFDNLDVEFIQPELTVVNGSVVDEDQNPIETEIVIISKNDGEVVTKIMSDEEGKYFATLKNGLTYEFIIEHQGMKAVNTSLIIPGGDEAQEVKTWHFILSKQ